MTEAGDASQIRALLAPLIGQPAWGCRLGHGSFVTLEFGQPQPASGRVIHGAWHVWVYGSAWRIEREQEVIAGSDDEREVMQAAAAALDGRRLEELVVEAPTLDACWTFSGGYRLRLFPMSASRGQHWMVFLPDRRVLTAGPGTSWQLEPADGERRG